MHDNDPVGEHKVSGTGDQYRDCQHHSIEQRIKPLSTSHPCNQSQNTKWGDFHDPVGNAQYHLARCVHEIRHRLARLAD